MDRTETCAALYDAFSPIVKRVLGDKKAFADHLPNVVRRILGTTRVEFLESNSMVDIYLFIVPIRPDPTGHEELRVITASDILAIAQALDSFCTDLSDTVYRGNTTRKVNGIKFVIGAGNDSLAVQFENNEFKIWLRHFK